MPFEQSSCGAEGVDEDEECGHAEQERVDMLDVERDAKKVAHAVAEGRTGLRRMVNECGERGDDADQSEADASKVRLLSGRSVAGRDERYAP